MLNTSADAVGLIGALDRDVVSIAHPSLRVSLTAVLLGSPDVLVISNGKAVERGPARAILTAPRTSEARASIKGELPWTSFAAAC
jgi:tungstate transport system ATP-binding protein